MPKAIDKASQKLFTLLHDASAADGKPPKTFVPSDAHDAEAIRTVIAGLQRIKNALYDRWEALSNDGAYEAAARLDKQLDSLAALSIGLNRRLVAFLDGAADLAAAREKLDRINGKLKREAEKVEAQNEDLSAIAGVIGSLAKIVDLA